MTLKNVVLIHLVALAYVLYVVNAILSGLGVK
jgi:hypothetical protein